MARLARALLHLLSRMRAPPSRPRRPKQQACGCNAWIVHLSRCPAL